jgi:branched-chain amino acid transport system permease protein
MMGFYSSNIVLVQGTFIAFLLGLSVQVPIRFGVFSFAGVACYGIGGYTTAITISHDHWTVPEAIAAAAIIALAFSLVLGLILRRLSGLYLAMATIAVTLIVEVVANNGGTLTGGPSGLYGVLSNIGTIDLVAVAVVAIALLVLTERGRMGRRIDVVREDPELGMALGINVARYRLAAFLASGLLGAVAGALEVLLLTNIAPSNITFSIVVEALTVVIVGGVRSWLGAAIGAIIVTWLPFVLQSVDKWQDVIYSALIVVAAIFFPGGVLGVLTEAIGWARQRYTALRVGHPVDEPVPSEAAVGGPEPSVSATPGRETVASAGRPVATADTGPVLETRQAAVHFGGVRAVDGISLSVRPGLIVGLLGPNGSGKSTLLAALTGLVRLTGGAVLLDGAEYQGVPAFKIPHRGVSRTFQTVRLIPGLTVRENVQLGSDFRRASGGLAARRRLSGAARQRTTEVMRQAGVADVRDVKPAELSYGAQRRVEIARAMAMQPRILLLDEPTAGMNQAERESVSELLKQLRSEKVAQLLVEHDVQMMVDTCDLLYAMNAGTLIAEGTPHSVVTDPGVQKAYLGKEWTERAKH